ncbi:RNA polymerase sigma factor [Paenibacillus mesophilus]|uniref:RNA polymerase sigma factor n=1 Tax=Paenibacillus mesophilus TaxID=2582849 RepID=UPI00110D5BFB|nr:RNA polymerase sigma factor [Paenibacillus mesophilus]TMV43046.1 RNA polymerase sigma factor [Paenibacillus mesophilus]
MFDQLIIKFESDLRSYCRMLTGTPWDAEDLYQNTLLKAFKAKEKLVQHPSPRALLFRIASNGWIDECRKRKANVGLPEGYEALSADFDEYSLDVKDGLEFLVSAVPPFQVAVVLLADVFEYNSREIADMLKTTEGAAKAALHRARKRLSAIKQDAKWQETYAVNTAEQSFLIEQFLAAFRLREPMAIAKAYHLLTKAGIRAERHLLQGKLYFTFRDPEGNAFTVIAG